MRFTAACVISFFGFGLFAGTGLCQTRSTAGLVGRASDGSWYTATETEALYPNPKSTVRKYLADFRTVVWERQVTGDYPRELRPTPDGGVALLSVAPGERGTLRAWDPEGNGRFSTFTWLPSASVSSWPDAHFAVEPEGGFLVVNAGGSLHVSRISAAGDLVAQVDLPIPSSSVAGVELDGNGSAFVAGGTESDNLPVSGGAIQPQRLGGTCSRGMSFPMLVPCTSGWIAKLGADTLEIEALTYLGGAAENAITALAADRQGSPVVAGATSPRFGEVENAYPRTPGTLPPSTTHVSQPVATLSRLSPNLDVLVDSNWIEGAATTAGLALAIDSENRILLGGSTSTVLNVPNRAEWSEACGPRSSQTTWGFLMQLSEDMERIERVFQFEDIPAGRITLDDAGNPALREKILPLNSRVNCIVNGAGYNFTSVAAPGELVTVYGGPFADDEPVALDGRNAAVLFRSGTKIDFVTPRQLDAGRNAELRVGAESAGALTIVTAQPTWKAAVTAEGRLTEAGNYLIEARRSDGEANSKANPFRPNEEVRAYATGVDLTKPLRVFIGYPRVVDIPFMAEYVPGTAEGVVEFRFTNPYPTLTPGGLTLLRIENDGIQTPANPGFIWNPSVTF